MAQHTLDADPRTPEGQDAKCTTCLLPWVHLQCYRITECPGAHHVCQHAGNPKLVERCKVCHRTIEPKVLA